MGKWSKQGCINSALEYNCFKTWIRKRKTAYLAARDNEWLDECCAHMKSRVQVWTFEECLASASSYTGRTDWRAGDRGAYNEAMINGWFDRCTEHMKLTTHRVHDRESCSDSASQFKAHKRWLKGARSAYEAAKRPNILQVYCSYMPEKRELNEISTLDECCKQGSNSFEKWTFEKCKESALKFKKIMDWGASEPRAYAAAKLNGWLPCIKKLYYERNARAWIKKNLGGG